MIGPHTSTRFWRRRDWDQLIARIADPILQKYGVWTASHPCGIAGHVLAFSTGPTHFIESKPGLAQHGFHLGYGSWEQ